MTDLNWNSRQLTHGWQRGVTAFFHGLGMSEADFDKPQVGIGVPLLEGNLCNQHAYALGSKVAEGCRAAGLLGFPFGTPAVSDNLTQGLEGGGASLVSRNLIANSAECVVSAHCYDAMVGLHHCDKNGPGFAMALARMNYPGLILSGGSIQPGCYQGRSVTILDVYDSQAAASVGAIPQAEADEIRRVACPGPGGCGIAASFNTWGLAMEAIGLMPPQSSSIPAIDPAKQADCLNAGQLIRGMLERNIRARDILTRQAFDNAAATIAAAGGSTNAVLHLLALAREAQVDFTLKDLQLILKRTPVLCSFAPRGTKTMVDLHNVGGTSVLLKHLIRAGLIDGSCLTVTGRSISENVANANDAIVGWDQRRFAAPAHQVGSMNAKGGPALEASLSHPTSKDVVAEDDLFAPVDAPFKPFADMQVCFGNLAPDGIVFKVSSLSEPRFRGPAICFQSGRDVSEAVEHRRIRPGHVIVLRYQGPVAAGMPEVVLAASALSVPELNGKVALISDTRVSGISHGAIGVHCAPEAAVGGPIALVHDGDEISFDLMPGTITLHVPDEELNRRRQQWQPPTIKHARGYLADFAATVAQANHGCVSRAFHSHLD
ncbi:MAG: dihydroxy-acid dehydratase [Planctomycetota bacterium]|nr:MAG: dihydroxy-acid dehydratase [Planctomycetota bacterium]